MFSIILLVANFIGTLEVFKNGQETSIAVWVTLIVGIMDMITFGCGYLLGGM